MSPSVGRRPLCSSPEAEAGEGQHHHERQIEATWFDVHMERSALRLTTAIAVAACPITTWWLLGDLSESATAEDYIFRAPELTGDQQLAIGLVATLLFVTAAYVIAIALRAQHLTWVDVRPVLPLLLAGIFCGFALRVVTARVGGANIGGGMILMFGPFFLIAMIAWSCVLWWVSRGR